MPPKGGGFTDPLRGYSKHLSAGEDGVVGGDAFLLGASKQRYYGQRIKGSPEAGNPPQPFPKANH